MERLIFLIITIFYICFVYKILLILVNEDSEIKKVILQLITQIISALYGVYLFLFFLKK